MLVLEQTLEHRDGFVPKENTLKAISTMRARGVGAETVRHYVLPGRKYDHMLGILPGLIHTRKFFDGGFDAVPTSPDTLPEKVTKVAH